MNSIVWPVCSYITLIHSKLQYVRYVLTAFYHSQPAVCATVALLWDQTRWAILCSPLILYNLHYIELCLAFTHFLHFVALLLLHVEITINSWTIKAQVHQLFSLLSSVQHLKRFVCRFMICSINQASTSGIWFIVVFAPFLASLYFLVGNKKWIQIHYLKCNYPVFRR